MTKTARKQPRKWQCDSAASTQCVKLCHNKKNKEKAGWITGKSDAACFVLGGRGDAGLLRQDEKTPRVLYNVDTKVLKNQLHIAGAHRRSEFIRMVYREKRPPGTCSLQIRGQQHLGQPGSQKSRNVRLKVPLCQESSPRHRRSSRSSCRRHTDLPSDSHRHQPPGSHR